MSGQISAFFGGSLFRTSGRSAGDGLKRPLEGFFAVVSFKLARLVDELLALRFGFFRGSLLGHCYFLFFAGAFLTAFVAALFLAGLGFTFGTEGNEIGSEV